MVEMEAFHKGKNVVYSAKLKLQRCLQYTNVANNYLKTFYGINIYF